MAQTYRKTVAAVKAANTSQWDIADALLAEVKDGAFEQVSDVLTEQGFEYDSQTLRNFRNTAESFPRGKRTAGVSFEAHRAAGSPEMLKRVIKQTGNPRVQRWVVRETVAAIREAENQARERLADEARRDAERARKEAEAAEALAQDQTDPQARREAEEAASLARGREKQAAERVAPTGQNVPVDPSREEVERVRKLARARHLANEAIAAAEEYGILMDSLDEEARRRDDVDGVLEAWAAARERGASNKNHLKAVS